ncbi:hypothetical protein Q3G72_006762 [Acer saccharum]|nr:hypothetical protein Q3G72_006762 [Acer saccharum]
MTCPGTLRDELQRGKLCHCNIKHIRQPLNDSGTVEEFDAVVNEKGLQDKIKLVPLNLQDRPAWYKEKVYPGNKVLGTVIAYSLYPLSVSPRDAILASLFSERHRLERSVYMLISEGMAELEYLQPSIAVVRGFIGV